MKENKHLALCSVCLKKVYGLSCVMYYGLDVLHVLIFLKNIFKPWKKLEITLLML